MSTEAIAEKVKFTPGPWVIGEAQAERAGSMDIYDAQGDLWLFSVMGSHVGPKNAEETMANAKLTAAAPNMAEAIREYISKTENPYASESDRTLAYENLKKSLNKAIL